MSDGLALTSREGFDLVTADGVGVEGSSPCAEECCGPRAGPCCFAPEWFNSDGTPGVHPVPLPEGMVPHNVGRVWWACLLDYRLSVLEEVFPGEAIIDSTESVWERRWPDGEGIVFGPISPQSSGVDNCRMRRDAPIRYSLRRRITGTPNSNGDLDERVIADECESFGVSCPISTIGTVSLIPYANVDRGQMWGPLDFLFASPTDHAVVPGLAFPHGVTEIVNAPTGVVMERHTVSHAWAAGAGASNGGAVGESSGVDLYRHPVTGELQRRVTWSLRLAIRVQTAVDCDGQSHAVDVCQTAETDCESGLRYLRGVPCDPAVPLGDPSVSVPYWYADNVTACRVRDVGGRCWTIEPGGASVAESALPANAVVQAEVIDADSPGPMDCCACEPGCINSQPRLRRCVNGGIDHEAPLLSCCCDPDNYTLRLAEWERAYTFLGTAGHEIYATQTLVVPGLRRVVSGVVAEEIFPVLRSVVRDTNLATGEVVTTVLGDSDQLWLPFVGAVCGHYVLRTDFGGSGSDCTRDDRDPATGLGQVYGVLVGHTCRLQTLNATNTQWGILDGSPLPQVRSVDRVKMRLEVETTSAAKCRGGCNGRVGTEGAALRAWGRRYISPRVSRSAVAVGGRGCGECREEGGF